MKEETSKSPEIKELVFRIAAELLEPTRARMIPPHMSFTKGARPTDRQIVDEAVRQAWLLVDSVFESWHEQIENRKKP